MNKRVKTILLVLIAVVAIVLVIALLRGCGNDSAEPKTATEDELPLDDSPLVEGTPAPDLEENKPNIDPQTGVELEPDELPIVPA